MTYKEIIIMLLIAFLCGIGIGRQSKEEKQPMPEVRLSSPLLDKIKRDG